MSTFRHDAYRAYFAGEMAQAEADRAAAIAADDLRQAVLLGGEITDLRRALAAVSRPRGYQRIYTASSARSHGQRALSAR